MMEKRGFQGIEGGPGQEWEGLCGPGPGPADPSPSQMSHLLGAEPLHPTPNLTESSGSPKRWKRISSLYKYRIWGTEGGPSPKVT